MQLPIGQKPIILVVLLDVKFAAKGGVARLRVDALGAAAALALRLAPPVVRKRLVGDVAAHLEAAKDLDGRHILPRLLADLNVNIDRV